MGLIKPTLDYADIADADLVIEAVYEQLQLKKDVFARIDRSMGSASHPSAALRASSQR
jgi:3-hydroxyacyl-CoA dehydrogenase